MKKYRDLYKVKKQQYEEPLQRYQEDHMDEVEIISLHKRCNKTNSKVATKEDTNEVAKTGAKAVTKASTSVYHFFLREQLGKMTGEDQKSFYSIVSTRCRKIKEDPARLFAYNNRAMQMRNEAEKPTKSGDDPLVDSTV